MVKKIQLVIKCETHDIPIAFRILAVEIGEQYEETLKLLLELEKKNPLEKKSQGVTVRL